MDAELQKVVASCLERLSHDFEMCVYGLGEVRREWEQRGGESSVIYVV